MFLLPKRARECFVCLSLLFVPVVRVPHQAFNCQDLRQSVCWVVPARLKQGFSAITPCYLNAHRSNRLNICCSCCPLVPEFQTIRSLEMHAIPSNETLQRGSVFMPAAPTHLVPGVPLAFVRSARHGQQRYASKRSTAKYVHDVPSGAFVLASMR